MTDKGRKRNDGKIRKIVVLKCDSCGKENRIRESNLYQNQIDAINNNNGCYCSKCHPQGRKDFSLMIFPGEFYVVYPKVVSLQEFQERQEGVKRAKDILRRGILQLDKQKH